MTVTCDPVDWGDSATTAWTSLRDDAALAVGIKKE
jgi:hypothetical protein